MSRKKVLFWLVVSPVMILIVTPLIISGCSDNTRAKMYGGSVTITVPKDKQFVNITWKEGSSLWVLTCDREEGHQPRKYYFDEKSSWGVVEGQVIISEEK